MPPVAGKAKAGGDNFRARRLSVSDIDTSEFEKANTAGTTPQPSNPKARARRMSMSPEMGVVKPRTTLPFPLEYVGTYSCHGVEPGMRQGETSAKINQDRGCVVYPFGEPTDSTYDQALFCVYDGHGALGDKVSHYTMDNIQAELEKHPDLQGNPAKALKETFNTVDKALQANKSIDAELSGTTAVVVLYRQDKSNGKLTLWTACSGDSRATLMSIDSTSSDALLAKDSPKAKVTDMSEDQKPDTPAEAARIKKCGGFISPPEEEWGGPARVWLDANMTLPGLAMARSIGDHLVSSVGVIAEPVVVEHTIDHVPENETDDGAYCLVMASDGVWEFIESNAACAVVKKFLFNQGAPDSTVAVTKLIETAAAKWRQEEGDYRDDITAIVVRMRNLFKSNALAAAANASA